MTRTNSTAGVIALVAFAFVALFGLSAFFGSFYTVEDGQVAVIDTFGKYDDTESGPGLHWKWPFIQDITVMDGKMQTVSYKRGGQEDGDPFDGITNRPLISILDAKNLPIGIELTVQYTPDTTEMSHILRTWGENYFERKLNPIIRDITRDVASGYDAEDIARKRGEIGSAMKAAIAESFKDIPFILNEVAIRDIALPPSVAEKIRQVQEAKQEEQRLAMVEKQAEVNKKIEVINAQRVAEVNVTTARGEAEAILTKAKAQAEANRKVAASLTELLVRQNQIERWDGVVAKYQLGNSGTFLNLPTEK